MVPKTTLTCANQDSPTQCPSSIHGIVWARDYSQQVGCMKPLSEGRKLCATCHHRLALGPFYLLTNTAATRKNCVGKNHYLCQETLQRNSSKLKHAREDHQVSTESLGSDPHLTLMKRVLPISNEVSSTMLISMC